MSITIQHSTVSMVCLLGSSWVAAAPSPSPPTPPPPANREIAPPEVRDIRIGDDPHMRYVLFGAKDLAKSPTGGFKVLIVMPGGDGGADFQPFVTNIWKNSLGPDWLVAQLVAPQWSQQQAKTIVWPTAKSTRPEVQFITEQFVASVFEDVKAKAPVNAKFVFSLSWSSGGPAAYAVSVMENTPITGTFVAMSVFKPDLLPDLSRAKGKPYYILHSPQDFIPMSFPEAARDRLAEHGGITTLQTYEGGHGWRGDVFKTIRTGVRWLEEQVTAASEPDKPRNPADS